MEESRGRDWATYRGVNMTDVIKGRGCQKCNWTGYMQGLANKLPVACIDCSECILCKGTGTVITIGNKFAPCTVCGKKEVKEVINHPLHYGGDVVYEAIKVIEAWELDFCIGNAVKYLSRAKHKGNELEDLRKARWYLNRKIEQLMKEKENG